MYHKATFISICNDFGIYLSVHYSKILWLMKIIGILLKKLTGLFPPKACLNKPTESAVVQFLALYP